MTNKHMPLNLWPEKARERLMGLQFKPGDYAVFDADNTLWEGDVTESLIMSLELNQHLRLDALHPKLLDEAPQKNETILDRYERICQSNVQEGYVWCVQVLNGMPLGTVINELLSVCRSQKPLQQNGLFGTRVAPKPRPFKAQKQLISWLKSNGVAVFVVSASPECLVQALACDPMYGFGLKRSSVLGLNMEFITPLGKIWTPARHRNGLNSNQLFAREELASRYTMTLSPPATCFGGKALAIEKWISSTQNPILVAGDSSNDIAMLKKATQMALHVSKSEKDNQAIDNALSSGGKPEKMLRVLQKNLLPETLNFLKYCTE